MFKSNLDDQKHGNLMAKMARGIWFEIALTKCYKSPRYCP